MIGCCLPWLGSNWPILPNGQRADSRRSGCGYPNLWPSNRNTAAEVPLVIDLQAIDGLIEIMTAQLAPLRERRDPRRFFHATYLRTTQAVRAELSAGVFDDLAWVERWDVAFARFYLDALQADLTGSPVPGPWAAAFAAAERAVPPLQHVLLGMNAHINYDLPQALLAVISDAEFDDAPLMARRAADHRRIDPVLGALVDWRDGPPDVPGS